MLQTIYPAANIRSIALCLGCMFYPTMAISDASTEFASSFERMCIKQDVPTSSVSVLLPGMVGSSMSGDGRGGRDYAFQYQTSNAEWIITVNISKSGEITRCSASGTIPSDTIRQAIDALPSVINDRLPPYIIRPEGNLWLLEPDERIGFIYLVGLRGGFVVGLDYLPTSLFTSF